MVVGDLCRWLGGGGEGELRGSNKPTGVIFTGRPDTRYVAHPAFYCVMDGDEPNTSLFYSAKLATADVRSVVSWHGPTRSDSLHGSHNRNGGKHETENEPLTSDRCSLPEDHNSSLRHNNSYYLLEAVQNMDLIPAEYLAVQVSSAVSTSCFKVTHIVSVRGIESGADFLYARPESRRRSTLVVKRHRGYSSIGIYRSYCVALAY